MLIQRDFEDPETKKKDKESDASVDANKKQKDCKSLDTCTGIKV